MNLSPLESAERIACHFASISQEFDPIVMSELPPNIQERLNNVTVEGPLVEEYEVHEKIRKAKKPNSNDPGDIPKKLIKEYSVEFSKPTMMIFNKITRLGEYQRQ